MSFAINDAQRRNRLIDWKWLRDSSISVWLHFVTRIRCTHCVSVHRIRSCPFAQFYSLRQAPFVCKYHTELLRATWQCQSSSSPFIPIETAIKGIIIISARRNKEWCTWMRTDAKQLLLLLVVSPLLWSRKKLPLNLITSADYVVSLLCLFSVIPGIKIVESVVRVMYRQTCLDVTNQGGLLDL